MRDGWKGRREGGREKGREGGKGTFHSLRGVERCQVLGEVDKDVGGPFQILRLCPLDGRVPA
jgi:hypothetical protein